MKKLVEGPLGLKMADRQAKELETLMKTLPKDCQKLQRKASVPDSVEFVQGERADVSLVSAESMDRDGEIVLAKGIDLSFFQANPVVTFAHKYDELPVGRAAWVKQVIGGIKAKTIYTDATEIARAVWQMTKEGILKGKSIGFLPTFIRSPSQEEVGRNPTWKNARAVIESCVLLEYAVAPIPVNQDALVEAVAKGIADKASLERLGLSLPTPTRAKPSKLDQHRKTLENLTLDPERIAGLVNTILAGRGRV